MYLFPLDGFGDFTLSNNRFMLFNLDLDNLQLNKI